MELDEHCKDSDVNRQNSRSGEIGPVQLRVNEPPEPLDNSDSIRSIAPLVVKRRGGAAAGRVRLLNLYNSLPIGLTRNSKHENILFPSVETQ